VILCRVTGDVVAPHKNAHLAGNKLLICQPVGLDGRTSAGASFLALDVAQAGQGDLVLVLKEGGGARIIFADDKIPLQTVVVAVVDDIEIDARAGESIAERMAMPGARGRAAPDEQDE
jgi:microcompartment protein CcmK/EutM